MRWRHSAYLCGDHEEAEEPVGEQHLHLLVVGGQVALRVVRLVRVGAAPLETLEHGNVISQHESFCITHYVIPTQSLWSWSGSSDAKSFETVTDPQTLFFYVNYTYIIFFYIDEKEKKLNNIPVSMPADLFVPVLTKTFF